jgi:histidinol dehydrogenase
MLRLLHTSDSSPEAIRAALTPSSFLEREAEEAAARAIVADVRARGDAALREYTERFDGPALDDLRVSPAEMEAAAGQVSPAFHEAVAVARERIAAFHTHGRLQSWTEERNGSTLGQIVRPLATVGVLVPGAKAPLPSTLLMTVVPARVAGVGRVIVCTPPRRDGTVNPHTLVAAQAAGVDAVYKVAGAQAVAAMAYGTESIARVDKIVGPGPIYTVLAKRLVFGHVDIESLPGPTEVVVIADETANPRSVAADLLSQAEHGADSLVVLLTPSAALAEQVNAEIARQVPNLSRAAVIRACLEKGGTAVVTRDLDEAAELADLCAPEHVELMVRDPEPLLARLRNAGAILVGEYSSEPIGDYIAGPSHVLPTSGTARFASPLTVNDFLKVTTLIRFSATEFDAVAPHAITLAAAEGLDAHAAALRARLEGPPAGERMAHSGGTHDTPSAREAVEGSRTAEGNG